MLLAAMSHGSHAASAVRAVVERGSDAVVLAVYQSLSTRKSTTNRYITILDVLHFVSSCNRVGRSM